MNWYLIYSDAGHEKGWYLCSKFLYESLFPARSFNVQLVAEITGWLA